MPDSTENPSGGGEEDSSDGNSSSKGSSGGGPGGPPIGGFGPGEAGKDGGDGAARVTLSEAAQATEDVLEGCRRELQLLRQWLRGREGSDRQGELGQGTSTEGLGEGQEGSLTPRERALRVASRLEACAGALRNASTPRDS